MRVGVLSVVVAAWLLAAWASPAAAQAAFDSGARVSGFFAGSFGDGGATPSFGASVGYRFSPHFGFELDAGDTTSLNLGTRQIAPVPLDLGTLVQQVPSLGGRLPAGMVLPGFLGGPFVVDRSARVVHFLANFVGEFPSPARWLRPYVLAGGGVANLEERDTYSFVGLDRGLQGELAALGLSTIDLGGLNLGQLGTASRSQTALAMNAGGGVDFQLWRGFALGADVRYLHLFAEEGGYNFARIGARASYRWGTREGERYPRPPRRRRR